MATLHTKCDECWDPLPCSCPAQHERDRTKHMTDYSVAISDLSDAVKALADAVKALSQRVKRIEAASKPGPRP
jgi:hypothetical protein